MSTPVATLELQKWEGQAWGKTLYVCGGGGGGEGRGQVVTKKKKYNKFWADKDKKIKK